MQTDSSLPRGEPPGSAAVRPATPLRFRLAARARPAQAKRSFGTAQRKAQDVAAAQQPDREEHAR
jgi:hypothetical protein